MTYPIFLCRGVGLPTNDVDRALSAESHIPFGASTPLEAAADWVRAQVHPVHGSLSVFAVEVIPHNPGGVDGEALCYVVRRLPDERSMIGTYTDEVAAEMVAAAEDAALDANYEGACHLSDSALREAHAGDDDEV